MYEAHVSQRGEVIVEYKCILKFQITYDTKMDQISV